VVSQNVNTALIHTEHGGPEVLFLREQPLPLPGPSEIRVRVSAAGLNPVDWQIVASSELAAAFGITLPSGFGNDFAGTVDAIGSDVDNWEIGDRVFGGARGQAAAEYLVVPAGSRHLHRTPDRIDDVTASVLDVAGRTASAVIDALSPGPDDVLLVSAAAGGVGTLVVQLAVRAGARVLGTGSPASFEFIRALGAEPVEYGQGLAGRVAELAQGQLSAAADLFGSEAAEAALQLGVLSSRVVTIEADRPPGDARAVNGSDARNGALEDLALSIERGEIRVHLAAAFPLEQFREAVELQRSRHLRGKVTLTMSESRSD
jgi:NADPH:quinone reductase-like Zn-dependent oxidoreductase